MTFALPFPKELYRPLIPNGRRRAPWHDYRSRCIYMITMNAAGGTPPLSKLTGIPGSHEFPPTAVRSQLGEIIMEQISAIKTHFPAVCILRRVIMPEHIHFVIFIRNENECSLSQIISRFKVESGKKWASISGRYAAIFEGGYHDRILLKKGQLQKMLNYVSDNPRRRLERSIFHGFHSRHNLTDTNGFPYEAYGNIHLIEDPDIEAVKISRRYSADELRKKKLCWKRTIENGGVLVSPFISQAERKVRDWCIANGGRLILIAENGFGARFSPKGQWHDLCSQGRLLIIAPREHKLAKEALTRSKCESMNRQAAAVAAGKIRICR